MNVSGYRLASKSTNATLRKWTSIPPRLDLPNGDILFSADASWQNETYKIEAATWTEADPAPIIPQIISDRQFFQQLAVLKLITWDEAEAAVGPGTIPAAISAALDALPDDQLRPARVIFIGARDFQRNHPLVATLAAALKWDDKQIDALWTAAAEL